MVRPKSHVCRPSCWLPFLPVIWLTLSFPAVAAARTQMDAAAQCAEGVELFLAGDMRAALPWLEAGFAGGDRVSFPQPYDLGVCGLFLGVLRNRTGNYTNALEAYGVALEVFSRS
jgi:hypothetical protein